MSKWHTSLLNSILCSLVLLGRWQVAVARKRVSAAYRFDDAD
jgi:hypothetical protein